MQSIWFCSKKGHPFQFALNAICGVTGKHLKANDLIKASQASPLTHCIKAICWLLNKRIIFYLDFCVCERVPFRSWIQVGGCHCSVYASYPCHDFVSVLSEPFFFLGRFQVPYSMRTVCTCSSSGQTQRTSQAFACCLNGNRVGMHRSLRELKRQQRNRAHKLIQSQTVDVSQGYYGKGWGGAWKLIVVSL